MRRMRRSAVALALVVFVVAATASAARIVRLDGRSNGRTVTLMVGDVVRVSLAGNPTTGYSWRLRGVNRAVLAPVTRRYVPTRPIRPGSGGTFVFTYRASAAGTTRLRLAYSRTPGGTAARTFSVGVVVKHGIRP